jgi:hypothetical protein
MLVNPDELYLVTCARRDIARRLLEATIQEDEKAINKLMAELAHYNASIQLAKELVK